MANRLFYQHYDPGEHRPAGAFSYCPFCRASLVPREVGGRLRSACPDCGFVQYLSPAATVSVLVVQGDQLLLGKRLAEPGRGGWSLPAGYIEFDDDLVGAGVREVREETGLEVEITSVFDVIVSFLSPRYHFLTVFMVARVVGGELGAADDLEEVGWFPLAGPLPEMAFQEDVDVIARYAAREWTGIPVGGAWPPSGRPRGREGKMTINSVNEVLIDLLDDNRRRLGRTLDRLDPAALHWRPEPEANSIALTLWHMGRLMDVFMTRMVRGARAEEECWFREGWAERTHYDPRGLGRDGWGSLNDYTQGQVEGVPQLTAEESLGYLDDVYGALKTYLMETPNSELQRPAPGFDGRFSRYQCVQMALMDNVRHLGEIMALKARWERAND
jgi:ADP-ribose pyrophosphatase YjhB (NUDIX family)